MPLTARFDDSYGVVAANDGYLIAVLIRMVSIGSCFCMRVSENWSRPMVLTIGCAWQSFGLISGQQEGTSSVGLRSQSQLPEDVVIEILVRLPVKFLIRFKCVCKRWFSLIGSDHLASKQLVVGRSCDDDHHGKFDSLLSSFRQRFNGFEFSLHSFDDTLLGNHSSRRFKIIMNSPTPWMHVDVAQPLDGILCLKACTKDTGPEAFVLWNPTTGEAKPIPPLTKHVDFFGLGRDPRTNQYKILAISIEMTSKSWSEEISIQNSITAAVYSLGSSSSWRVLDVSYFFDGFTWIGFRWIDDSYMNDHVITRSMMVLSADGRMLSMLGRYSTDHIIVSSTVVSFDLGDEIFIQTPMPPSWEGESLDYYTDGGYCRLRHCLNHGSICTLFFVPYEHFYEHFYVPVRPPMEIWVLIGCGARGSWTKQISFDYNLHPRSGVAKVDEDWVYYRQSLFSIAHISAKEGEGDCIESGFFFTVKEFFSRGRSRTLFTFPRRVTSTPGVRRAVHERRLMEAAQSAVSINRFTLLSELMDDSPDRD
ncbi:hypothetical protein Dimus_032534 [Dionaea muscipula]